MSEQSFYQILQAETEAARQAFFQPQCFLMPQKMELRLVSI